MCAFENLYIILKGKNYRLVNIALFANFDLQHVKNDSSTTDIVTTGIGTTGILTTGIGTTVIGNNWFRHNCYCHTTDIAIQLLSDTTVIGPFF